MINEENPVPDTNNIIRPRYECCGLPSIQARDQSSDPTLVDPSSNDYHLHAASPAVNHGDGSIAPQTDFDGTLHSQYYIVDMGAYKFIYP
jgi:hypothetical protein